MKVRMEEFTAGGRDFLYLDMSGLRSPGDFLPIIEAAGPIVGKYGPASLHTITDVKRSLIDTAVKEALMAMMSRNKPHVRSGAILGADGIKKIMLNSMFTLCGRRDMVYVDTREQGVERLLGNG